MSKPSAPEHRMRWAVVAALAVMVAGCSGGDSGTSTTPAAATAASTATSAASTTSSVPVEVASIDTAGDAFDLVIGWLGSQELTADDYERLFGPEFVAQVGHADLLAIFDQIGSAGPWTAQPADVETTTELVRAIEADGERLVVQLAIADGRISTLFFAPAAAFEAPADVDEAVTRLRAMGELHLVVADRSNGRCNAILEVQADDPAPIGSVFKLYVLAALDDAVAEGRTGWNDRVVIRDELDSLPTGTTQDVPAGNELSVEELATLMIAISDNTATDHLMDLLGRQAVESAVAASGHASPADTFPFLTTREMFVLKTAASGDLRDAYAAADVAARRVLLDTELALLDLPTLADLGALDWTTPIAIETIEWFASPMDICRVVARLVETSETRTILSNNPGVADEAGMWSYIGFKGGSEPGVLAMAWYVEDETGTAFVVAGTVHDANAPIDEAEAVGLLGYIRDHVVEVPR